MRTYEQLKAFAEANKIHTMGIGKELKTVGEVLRPDETISSFVNGTYTNRTWAIFVTTHRVIFFNKNLLVGGSQIDIPLDKVNSVGSESGFLLSEIHIWDGGSKMAVKNIQKGEVAGFMDALNAALDANKSKGHSSSPVGGSSTVEALEKLAALKDKGILTDVEFQEQKKKILAS